MYEDGTVYSNFSNKFLKPDILKLGYRQYSLSINGKKKRYKAHRLVALLFLPTPEKEKNMVDHLDGDKTNNHYSNLEWVTCYENNKRARDMKLNDVSKSNTERWKNEEWARKTRKRMSEFCLSDGRNKWKLNPRFKYLITDSNGNEYSRTDFAKIFNICQSYADVTIRKMAHGKKVHKRFEASDIAVKIRKHKSQKSQSTIESRNNKKDVVGK